MGYERFLMPIVPIAIVLMLGGVSTALGAAPRAWLVAAVAVAALVPAWWANADRERVCLDYAAGLRRAHVALGERIRALSAPTAVMAMDDAGAGPYYAARTNIDMMGLTDAHIGRLPVALSRKQDIRYVLNRKPDLIVLVSYVPDPSRPEDFRVPSHAALFHDAEFRLRYRFARRYDFGPGEVLQVWRRDGSLAVPASF
jgi:hypothetical protein